MSENLETWVIYFGIEMLNERKLSFMFCVETKTQFIIGAIISFEILETKKLVKILTAALQERILKDPSLKISISTRAKFLDRLKKKNIYKKFEETYLHSSFELEDSDYSDLQTDFRNQFFSIQLTKQNLWEAFLDHLNRNPNCSVTSLESVSDKYIQFWNKSKIRKSSLTGVNQKIKEVEKNYAEVVNSTPFDLTYTKNKKKKV
jgi:hypothetical protein